MSGVDITYCDKCGCVKTVSYEADYQVVFSAPDSLPVPIVNGPPPKRTLVFAACSCRYQSEQKGQSNER